MVRAIHQSLMFATKMFVTTACSWQTLSSRLRMMTSWHIFVKISTSSNAYNCHEVHFVTKVIWSRTYVPKLSHHEVTFHRLFLGLRYWWNLVLDSAIHGFSFKWISTAESLLWTFWTKKLQKIVGFENVNFKGYGIFSWNLFGTFGVTIKKTFFVEPLLNRIIHSYT